MAKKASATVFVSYKRCLSTVAAKRSEPLVTPNNQTERFMQKSCRVTVLGAMTVTGKAFSLLLKQNPLVSQIYLYDNESTEELAEDLNHLDTNSAVIGYSKEDLHCALRNADIIVMLGLEAIRADSSFQQKLCVEGKRLIQLSTAAAQYAPKAVFVDCVVPLSVTMALISEVYRKNHWYHPGKVVGSVAQQQMRLNTLLAHHQEVDPSSVHVPMLGGPEDDILLPLFSRALPKQLAVPAATEMINLFRQVDADASPSECSHAQHEYAPHGNAYAINRLVSTIAMGLLGDARAITTAFVRTNCVTSCRHLVSTVKFGPHGILHNYGVPKLTRFELNLFEKVTLELAKREAMAKEYAELIDNDTASRNDTIEHLYFPATIKFCPQDDPIVYDT